MANPNPDIRDLMQILLDRHSALLAELDTVTDPQLGDAILTEAQEVLHRINLTQNLLFIDLKPKLADAVSAVADADKQLTKDLKDIDDAAKFITKLTGFLGYVDKAIDIAKKVALL